MSTSSPLVSVITAQFNRAKTLSRCFDSLYRHDFDFEHIVIDGGSTDGSFELALSYNPTIAVTEADRGVYDALNKGLNAATGEYILFLHSDDVLTSEIKNVARFLKRSQHIDALISPIKIDYGSRVRNYPLVIPTYGNLSAGFMPAHPGVIVRRELFQRIGQFSLDFQTAGDYEWFVRACNYPILMATWDVPFMRMYSGGQTTRGLKSWLRTYNQMKRIFDVHNMKLSQCKLVNRYILKIIEFYK